MKLYNFEIKQRLGKVTRDYVIEFCLFVAVLANLSTLPISAKPTRDGIHWR
jgi:hypothetical protein